MERISSFVLDFIKKYVPGEDILVEEPMSRHTTFRAGGKAKCLVRIGSVNQLGALLPYFRENGIPYFILGNGSNLLVGDGGYPGVMLQIGSKMNRIKAEEECIRAEAGALLSRVAGFALENGLTGLEFASGIPGTVGGALVMNAGAYGGEIKQVVRQVTVIDERGEISVIENDAMEFGYRTSVIKKKPLTVLEAVFALSPGEESGIRARMEELAQRRKEKQPLEYASAGSTFKRPEGFFAGKLIMEAGLRGLRVGGAQVSEKHCGFVINTGGATAGDILAVIREVQKRVRENTGITLETEVILLGDC